MTDFQMITVMIAFGSLVAVIIFGLLNAFIAILNLIKKK